MTTSIFSGLREFGVPPKVWRKNGGRGTADSSAGRAAAA
jgi:hypothetical protein